MANTNERRRVEKGVLACQPASTIKEAPMIAWAHRSRLREKPPENCSETFKNILEIALRNVTPLKFQANTQPNMILRSH
jgi:hypothetical protein